MEAVLAYLGIFIWAGLFAAFIAAGPTNRDEKDQP